MHYHAFIQSICVKVLRKSTYSYVLKPKEVLICLTCFGVFFRIPILLNKPIPILSIYLCSRWYTQSDDEMSVRTQTAFVPLYAFGTNTYA